MAEVTTFSYAYNPATSPLYTPNRRDIHQVIIVYVKQETIIPQTSAYYQI